MARIMLVDDDEDVRKVLREVLERAGHEVIEAGDGQTALRWFAGSPPDLVVSDVYMPSMDGVELLMRLRETFPEAKVIVMSGGGFVKMDKLLEAAKSLGAIEVLTKPVRPAELTQAVAAALGTGG